MSTGYETFDVPRPGGSLRVGRWGVGPGTSSRRTA